MSTASVRSGVCSEASAAGRFNASPAAVRTSSANAAAAARAPASPCTSASRSSRCVQRAESAAACQGLADIARHVM